MLNLPAVSATIMPDRARSAVRATAPAIVEATAAALTARRRPASPAVSTRADRRAGPVVNAAAIAVSEMFVRTATSLPASLARRPVSALLTAARRERLGSAHKIRFNAAGAIPLKDEITSGRARKLFPFLFRTRSSRRGLHNRQIPGAMTSFEIQSSFGGEKYSSQRLFFASFFAAVSSHRT